MEAHENLLEEKPIIVPTREHSLLAAFIGKWTIEGQNLAKTPVTASSDVKGIETYDWLPGGFFVIYRWERHFATATHKGLGMISHDETNHTFSSTHYDNMGNKKTYEMVHDEEGWKLIGETERAIITFDETGNSFTENWEILDDDNNWQPLCSLNSKRIN
jgi:hypothetical protein